MTNNHFKANNYNITNISTKHDLNLFPNMKSSIDTMAKPVAAFNRIILFEGTAARIQAKSWQLEKQNN
jgi:hypothetical protein